jgi:hypothetical protein
LLVVAAVAYKLVVVQELAVIEKDMFQALTQQVH